MIDLSPLRDFIADHESEGAAKRLKISAYDVVWGKIAPKDRPKSLQSMTIGQVLAWQDSIDKSYPSEAAGRYQIMEDTLRGLYAEASMGLDDKFDVAGQDRLCDALLKRRGVDKYLAGDISAETFCNNLANEWASLPMVTGPKKGRSVYDGDGLNKAGVDVAPFLAVVRGLKAPQKAQPSAPKPVLAPTPAPKAKGGLAAIFTALLGIFGKG